MIARTANGAPSLVRTLTLQLVLTITLVMLMQAAIITIRDYIQQTDFLNAYIRREAQSLANIFSLHLRHAPDDEVEPWPRHYLEKNAAFYAFRIIDAEGRVIAGRNAAMLEILSPWIEKPTLRQDLWLRKLDPVQRMHVAGGAKHQRDGRDYWVELATFGDPDNTFMKDLALDIFDDIWLPMLPLIGLTMLVTRTSVRRQLRPLVNAASRADEISALERGDRLAVAELPAEASQFAAAINRLLDRVADLVSAERLFIARAAHELRTPLSIMMLEIGNLKDPKAKQLEADVHAMSEIVNQLLSLARLETARKPVLGPVDIATVVRELVARIVGWAEKDGHNLSFSSSFKGQVVGDETSLRDAVRNLIENAVKHTPPGTDIRIAVAADGAVIVEDSGPGLGDLPPEELSEPFRKVSTTGDGAGLGLAIVRHTAELHRGSLEIGPSELGGARFVMRLPAGGTTS